MSIITDIQNKPHAYKVRLMWIIISIVVVILIALWIIFNRMGSNVNTASDFLKKQAAEVKNHGQKLYEENK